MKLVGLGCAVVMILSALLVLLISIWFIVPWAAACLGYLVFSNWSELSRMTHHHREIKQWKKELKHIHSIGSDKK